MRIWLAFIIFQVFPTKFARQRHLNNEETKIDAFKLKFRNRIRKDEFTKTQPLRQPQDRDPLEPSAALSRPTRPRGRATPRDNLSGLERSSPPPSPAP